MTDDESDPETPEPATAPKLPQRQQVVLYFGFADIPDETTPVTEEMLAFHRSRRIAGILVVGVMLGLLWASFGPIPALVLAVVGAIWFGSALRAYGRH